MAYRRAFRGLLYVFWGPLCVCTTYIASCVAPFGPVCRVPARHEPCTKVLKAVGWQKAL